MSRMLWLSALFGLVAGAVGSFFSFLGPSLPTGPFMVLGATTIFAVAFLFAPRHGVVMRWWRRLSRVRRTHRENSLKSVFHVLEQQGFRDEGVTLEQLSARRRESIPEARHRARELRRHGFATLDRGNIFLTPEGWKLARAIVRNHRLWELYLTNAAQIAADHVHDDAERIEHVLGEDVVRRLEKRLDYATEDPHGRVIPSSTEVERSTGDTTPPDSVGYGRSR